MIDEWGIADGYHDVLGEWQPASADTIEALRQMMGRPEPGDDLWFVAGGSEHDLGRPCVVELEDGTVLPPADRIAGLPLGYHTLRPCDGGTARRLVVHPTHFPRPQREWGVAAQVYALWSQRSWGIGDLRDVGTLARHVAAAGGRVVLMSPLHAPAPTVPQEPSPYYPSTRRALNPLLIPMAGDPPPELVVDPGELIDRDAVWQAKRAVLESHFAADRWSTRWREWAHQRGLDDGGDLWAIARWNTIADDFGADWTQWPEELRHPDDATFDRLAAKDPAVAERVEFHAWCQWRADEALEQAAQQGAGLVGDLAVGFAPGGADAWQYQDQVALGARIGAPPDEFNTEGQGWGLPPFVPWRLRADGYRAFIGTVRACLRHMVGLRMDHVMGLFRQYWIPEGSGAADGAYVTFPAEELLAIVALEAERAGAFVVGEDLGTVQQEVRDALGRWGLLGTKVVLFEEEAPEAWPEMALATLTTHDLPTVSGLWAGGRGDPRLRERIARVSAAEDGEPAQDVVDRLHAQLLASPALVRLLTTDDLTGALDQPNVPGTVERTNWSRPLPLPVDEVLRLPV